MENAKLAKRLASAKPTVATPSGVAKVFSAAISGHGASRGGTFGTFTGGVKGSSTTHAGSGAGSGAGGDVQVIQGATCR